jgi:hypothetical protein
MSLRLARIKPTPRLGALAVVVLFLGMSSVAQADPSPPPSGLQSLTSNLLNNPYVQSVVNALSRLLQTTNGNGAFGKVTYFKRFEMQLETAPQVYREVHLHQGTIINPLGTTLNPGMTVSVKGTAQSDGSLDADQIDVR